MTTTETEAAAVPLTGQQYQVSAGRYRATVTEPSWPFTARNRGACAAACPRPGLGAPAEAA